MKEIDCCLVRHFEENLRLRSETGWAEFGYSKMDAPRVSRFLTAGQGERRLWERYCSGPLFFKLFAIAVEFGTIRSILRYCDHQTVYEFSHIKVIYLALLWCEYFNDSSILRFYISASSTSGGSWGGWRRIRAS